MRNLKDNESNMNKNNSLNQFYLKSDYKTISRDNIHLICSNNQEITLPQGDIDLIFPFLKKIISNSQSKDIKLQLPSISPKTLELYISILRRKSFNSVDLNQCCNIIRLSEFFGDEESSKLVINERLINLIDNENCLEVLLEFLEKVYKNSNHYKEKYQDVIQKCIECACKNIFFLINNKNDRLLALHDETIEEIFERYFQSSVFKANEDFSQIISLMMKKRKLNSVFDLLENERKKTINLFSRILNNDGSEPFLIWKVCSHNPNIGYYKESEPFSFENLDYYEFVIINHYNYENDTLNIAIKICNDKENSNSMLNLPLLSVICIKECNFKSKINFNCMVLDIKPKLLLCKIEKFSSFFAKTGFNSIEYTIEIFFNVSCNFSAILSHICKKFNQYYSLPSISKLSKNVMNLIVKSTCLNVNSEEEKIIAIKNWKSNKDEKIHNGEELYRAINWEKTSLECMLEFILSESKTLLSSVELQTILVKEFQRRFRNEKSNNHKWQTVNNSRGNESFVEENSQSFTCELISKLIQIASRHENTSKFTTKTSKLSWHNSLIFNKNEVFDTSPKDNQNFFSNNLGTRGTDSNFPYVNFKKFDLTEGTDYINRINTPQNEFSFIANQHHHHKRNLSNSNNYEMLNDTFKHLSNNLSFSKIANKSHNISPNRNLMIQRSVKYSNKTCAKVSLASRVVYTTQTNINTTNYNSNLATENKCTNNNTKLKTKNKLSKPIKSPIKKNKKTEKLSKSNFMSDMWLSSKPNYFKSKLLVEKIKKKIIDSSNNLANLAIRPKSLSQLKKKSDVPHLALIKKAIINNK